MSTPLTLIVEGKPLVFDVPVPVGEVVPANETYVWLSPHDEWVVERCGSDVRAESPGYFTARPPVAPESFADGDVAWVRVEFDEGCWIDPDGDAIDANSVVMRRWLADGTAYLLSSPRPESLADVLDDANLPAELRARIEKAATR